MDDSKIVDLYWDRSERAISETQSKYGRMLKGISRSLLNSNQDAEECVNDTYLSAWNRMPNDRPSYLGAYLSRIVRALSIDRFRSAHRQKRGGYENLCLELCECVPDSCDLEKEYLGDELAKAIDAFLSLQGQEKRVMFVRRYFYSDSIEDIAKRLCVSRSKVKTTLFRMRAELREALEKEGML